MRTTHVSGRASWAHKLVLVRHFPLIKKSYIVKSLRREKICFFFYNSWSERVEEKIDWVVNFHLITNVFSLVYLLDYLWLPLIRPFLPLVLCQKSDQKKKKSRKCRRTAVINWQFSVKNEQAIVKKSTTQYCWRSNCILRLDLPNPRDQPRRHQIKPDQTTILDLDRSLTMWN